METTLRGRELLEEHKNEATGLGLGLRLQLGSVTHSSAETAAMAMATATKNNENENLCKRIKLAGWQEARTKRNQKQD